MSLYYTAQRWQHFQFPLCSVATSLLILTEAARERHYAKFA